MVEKTKDEKIAEVFVALAELEDITYKLADNFKGTRFEGTADIVADWFVQKANMLTFWLVAKAA